MIDLPRLTVESPFAPVWLSTVAPLASCVHTIPAEADRLVVSRPPFTVERVAAKFALTSEATVLVPAVKLWGCASAVILTPVGRVLLVIDDREGVVALWTPAPTSRTADPHRSGRRDARRGPSRRRSDSCRTLAHNRPRRDRSTTP